MVTRKVQEPPEILGHEDIEMPCQPCIASNRSDTNCDSEAESPGSDQILEILLDLHEQPTAGVTENLVKHFSKLCLCAKFQRSTGIKTVLDDFPEFLEAVTQCGQNLDFPTEIDKLERKLHEEQMRNQQWSEEVATLIDYDQKMGESHDKFCNTLEEQNATLQSKVVSMGKESDTHHGNNAQDSEDSETAIDHDRVNNDAEMKITSLKEEIVLLRSFARSSANLAIEAVKVRHRVCRKHALISKENEDREIRLANLNRKFLCLKDELTNISTERDEMNAQSAIVCEGLQKQEQEAIFLQSQLAQSSQDNARLRRRLGKARNCLEETHHNVATLERNSLEQLQEVTRLHTQLRDSSTQYETLERECDELRTALANLQLELEEKCLISGWLKKDLEAATTTQETLTIQPNHLLKDLAKSETQVQSECEKTCHLNIATLTQRPILRRLFASLLRASFSELATANSVFEGVRNERHMQAAAAGTREEDSVTENGMLEEQIASLEGTENNGFMERFGIETMRLMIQTSGNEEWTWFPGSGITYVTGLLLQALRKRGPLDRGE